jgi:serine/threonine-protein kinase
MARNGPLYTLLSGGVLGVGLLVAAMAATPDETAADDQQPLAEATETQPAQTPEPTLEPTPEPTTEPAPSPTETEAAQAVTYVGYVDGGGASVAVIVTGDEAIAYLCDGNAVEAWLDGSAVAKQLDLTGDRGSLTGEFDDLQASGQAIADDQFWTFTIEAVEPPEGLYRFADTIAGGAEVVGGWIVLPDGTQVGALNVDGQTQPAPALDVENGQATVNGTVVTPERLG